MNTLLLALAAVFVINLLVAMGMDLVRRPERVSPLWYVSMWGPFIALLLLEQGTDGSRSATAYALQLSTPCLTPICWLHALLLSLPRALRPGGPTEPSTKTDVLLAFLLVGSLVPIGLQFFFPPISHVSLACTSLFWPLLFLRRNGTPRRQWGHAHVVVWWTMGSAACVPTFLVRNVSTFPMGGFDWPWIFGAYGTVSLAAILVHRPTWRVFGPLGSLLFVITMTAAYTVYAPLTFGVTMPSSGALVASPYMPWSRPHLDGVNLFDPDGTQILGTVSTNAAYRYAANAPSTSIGPVPIAADDARRSIQFISVDRSLPHRTLTWTPDGLRLDGLPTPLSMDAELYDHLKDIVVLAIEKNPNLSVQDVVTVCESTPGPCFLVDPGGAK